MMVGDPESLAIESGITRAYESPSLLAIGFFVIHAGGRSYGVRSPDATMLANSFDEVEKRLSRRGRHNAPFASEGSLSIASAVTLALYADTKESDRWLGLSSSELADIVYSNDLLWAPDGDAAFDDGSYVLQFDVKDRVRVVGFTRAAGYSIEPASLRDRWLPAGTFYGVLEEWRNEFVKEWASLPKIPASGVPDKSSGS